jgi:hypothetical protein
MQTVVVELLAAWRRAERLAASLERGSPEHAAVERACEHLRAAYVEMTGSGIAHVFTHAELLELIADVDVASDLNVS